MIPLGSKLAPWGGVISWNNSNREGRIHFVGKLTRVSDSGPSWPSCFFDMNHGRDRSVILLIDYLVAVFDGVLE